MTAEPEPVAVEWTVPHCGDKVCGRIVSRTATTAVVDWGEGRTETVRLADPTLRWLTAAEAAAGT